jgi:hypothetical protein
MRARDPVPLREDQFLLRPVDESKSQQMRTSPSHSGACSHGRAGRSGSSHYELLRAFVPDELLTRISDALEAHGYLTHEFGGDSVFIEAAPARTLRAADLGGCSERAIARKPAECLDCA